MLEVRSPLGGHKIWLRAALAGALLLCLMVLQFLYGGLPGLGRLTWIDGARPEISRAWVAPLPDPAFDQDRGRLDADLYEWRGGNALLCRMAGPIAAPCAADWYRLGPGRQSHDAIRHDGGGRFSVWHGQLYFSTPDGEAPQAPLLLRTPWTVAAGWSSILAGLALLWAAWPVLRRPSVAGLLLIACLLAGATTRSAGLLAWGGALLCVLHLLPQARRAGRTLSAAALALAGLVAIDVALDLILPAIGLVPDLQTSQLLKYLSDYRTDRPIVLLVGSSLTQYGIDEAALAERLTAQGHPAAVLRLGFGGMSIPEQIYYIRRYLATAQRKPDVVLFEVSGQYQLLPLLQLQEHKFSGREIAAMDSDNLRLSLAWALGADGDRTERLELTASLLGHFALHELHLGALPNSLWSSAVRAADFAGDAPKTKHASDTEIAADLAHGQSQEALSTEFLAPGVPLPDAVPTAWAQGAIREEIALFRAAGVTRFGFFAPPSRIADETVYGRLFCRGMSEFPCLPMDDAAFLATLGHDEDWLDTSHLHGPGRELYTAWLADRLATSGVLP